MQHRATQRFWRCYFDLKPEVRRTADPTLWNLVPTGPHHHSPNPHQYLHNYLTETFLLANLFYIFAR